MASGKPIITMTDITKVYSVGGEEVRALDGANLTIREGEFVSIIGPSGSGKSTLMNIIGCLDVADSGEYILDGQSIEQYSEEELAKIRNKKIGFVFQNFNLLSRMSAFSNVELPLIYQRMHLSERKEQAQRALDRVGLSDRSSHKPAELSGGQQQRVAIARALATDPAILLADEPTGNLDEATADRVFDQFVSLVRDHGSAALVATHNERLAARMDRVLRLHDGRIEA